MLLSLAKTHSVPESNPYTALGVGLLRPSTFALRASVDQVGLRIRVAFINETNSKTVRRLENYEKPNSNFLVKVRIPRWGPGHEMFSLLRIFPKPTVSLPTAKLTQTSHAVS